MKYRKYVLIVLLTVAVTFLAVPVHSDNSSANSKTPIALASGSLEPYDTNGIPGMKGMNVTVLGIIKTSSVAPACSLSNPPCAIPDTAIYYVVVNGRNYHLILTNSTQTQIPPNVSGSNVVITGLYVTPSTFQSNQWTPALFFVGDIYVIRITYFQTLPH